MITLALKHWLADVAVDHFFKTLHKRFGSLNANGQIILKADTIYNSVVINIGIRATMKNAYLTGQVVSELGNPSADVFMFTTDELIAMPGEDADDILGLCPDPSDAYVYKDDNGYQHILVNDPIDLYLQIDEIVSIDGIDVNNNITIT